MRGAIISGTVLVVGALAWFLLSPLIVDRTVEEAFPTRADVAAMNPGERAEQMREVMAAVKAMPDTPMSEPMTADEPTALKRGKFRDVDAIHKGSGDAVIYALGDGTHVVRLEDIRIANGPDLYVYLAEHADPATADDVEAGFVNLGKLKGNVGSQNYPIPPGTDVAKYDSVVIWCRLFSVLFSPAALSAP